MDLLQQCLLQIKISSQGFYINPWDKIKILSNLILVFFLLILTCGLFSQTFEFEYSTTNDDRLWDVFQTEDGNYYMVGHVAQPESNKYRGLLLKLNPEGQLEEERVYDIPNRAYDIYGIMQDTLGSLILCGKSSDTTDEMLQTKLELRRISYELETLDSNTFILDSNRRIGGIRKHINGNKILLISSLYSELPPPLSSFIFIINTSFDSLNFKRHDFLEGYQIQPLGDTAYWIVGRYGGTNYIILDSLLNISYNEEVPHIYAQCYGLKWDTDTSFYMCGWTQTHDIGIIRQYHPFNTAGYLHNTWGEEGVWDFPAISGALDYSNKDSIFIGATSPMSPWGSFASNFVVLQMDSSLNIRWERFYGEGKYYFELMKIIATNDGGCLLAGTRYDYLSGIPARDIYLIKLDKYGLIVGNNENPSITVRESIVYPNPGTNEIKVRIAAQYPESLFQLFDMHGKQIASQEIIGKWGSINTGFLKSGTYIYRITSKQGLFESGKWVKQ